MSFSLLRKIFKKDKPRGEIEKPESTRDHPVLEEGERLPVSGINHGVRAAYNILMRPRITEKTMADSAQGRYTFVVADTANKQEVRHAVFERFGVLPIAVRILTMPEKQRRRGRQIGWKSGFKKAVITLAEGQKIEVQ